MLRIVFLLLLSVACVSSGFSQPANREIVNQSVEWFSLTNNFKLDKTFTVILEGQFRFAREFEPMQQQARTALEINLNDSWSIVPVGYVYTWNYLYGKQPAKFQNHEHRLWQQVFYKHTVARKIQTDHRLRFEQRFIQVHDQTNEGMVIDEGYNNKQLRLRYRFMARMPFNKEKIGPKAFFGSVYDEAFLSFGKNVSFHEPDQNRIFGGLGYQFDKALSVQGGFLYQMLIKANGAEQENNLGFQVMFNYQIDLSKSE